MARGQEGKYADMPAGPDLTDDPATSPEPRAGTHFNAIMVLPPT